MITGRLIDFELTQKCTRCGEKSDDFSDNGNCVYGLFHGSPGAMEIHNAIVLLKRSTLWGFRYTEYVSDGDAKVLPHLRRANIYPDVELSKIECGNHLVKRGCSAIHKFGSTYKPSSPSEAPPAKSPRKAKNSPYTPQSETSLQSTAQPTIEPIPSELSAQPTKRDRKTVHFSEPLTTVIGPLTQLIAYPAAQPNTQPAPCIRLPEHPESFRRSSRIATKPAVKPSSQPITKPTIKFATKPTTKLTVQLNSPPAQPGKRGRKVMYP